MAIDRNSTKDSLFPKKPVKAKSENSIPVPSLSFGVQNIGTSDVPKSLDKITLPMNTDQKEKLDVLAKRLMKFRKAAGKERITANTLIRSLISVFLENEPPLHAPHSFLRPRNNRNGFRARPHRADFRVETVHGLE